MQQHMLVRMSHETESEAVTAIIRWLVAFIGPFVSVPPPPAGFASSAALVTSGTTLDKNAAASATRRVQLSQLTEAQRIAFVHETNVAMKVPCLLCGALYYQCVLPSHWWPPNAIPALCCGHVEQCHSSRSCSYRCAAATGGPNGRSGGRPCRRVAHRAIRIDGTV